MLGFGFGCYGSGSDSNARVRVRVRVGVRVHLVGLGVVGRFLVLLEGALLEARLG